MSQIHQAPPRARAALDQLTDAARAYADSISADKHTAESLVESVIIAAQTAEDIARRETQRRHSAAQVASIQQMIAAGRAAESDQHAAEQLADALDAVRQLPPIPIGPFASPAEFADALDAADGPEAIQRINDALAASESE